MQQDEELKYWQERQKRIRERRKRQIKRQMIIRALCIGVFFIFLLILAGVLKKAAENHAKTEPATVDETKRVTQQPDFMVELLTPNEYSRPQIALEQVNGIVIHYTANPGTTAQQNRNYFESLAETEETYASSHFVIGIEGEIIQCIPCNEIAYASNERNGDTIAIECCIPDDTGKFTDATYASLTALVAWLMGRYDLTTDDVIRHYDVTGKDCPKYFVENSGAWDTFKEDLAAYIASHGIEKTKQIN